MNIFAVESDPQLAAMALCDKHVVKMILESSQLLCTAHHLLGSCDKRPGYFLKATHRNHPCAIWVRETLGNYRWLTLHNAALCAEYSFRYGKRHKCEREGLVEWLLINPPSDMKGHDQTLFTQAMPDEFKGEDAVEAYRRYYLGAKRHLLVWTNREPPSWVPREWLRRQGMKVLASLA